MGDDGLSREQRLDELRALRQPVSQLEGTVESLRRSEAMHHYRHVFETMEEMLERELLRAIWLFIRRRPRAATG